MTLQEFQQSIREGIPAELPAPKPYDPEVNHAPKRKDILTKEEKKLAIRNALRYFEPRHHAVLAREFAEELEKYYLRRKRCGIPKLGTISSGYEIFVRNDRRTNSGDVFRSSAGIVSFA